MEKKKKVRPFLYYITKCLSKKWRIKFVKYLVFRKCGAYVLNLPDDLSAVKNILFVLPEDPLEALYQVVNIVSIMNHFQKVHKAQAVFLCEQKVAPYFKNFHGVSSLFEYSVEQRYLFSPDILELQKLLIKEYIDICLFLEQNPDLSLLHLVGQIQAKVRVAYRGTDSFPFFNLHIQPSNRIIHRTEQNNVMAKALGAKIHDDLHWSVTKETVEEILVMLKQSSIRETEWLGGIDAQHFYYTFGSNWTEELIDNLSKQNKRTWYLYVANIPAPSFINWLKTRKMPVFTDLPPSRLAALLHKSDCIISGKCMFFELANLLQKPAIGVFKENELHYYCKMTSQSTGIPYVKKPDEKTIAEISEKVASFVPSDGK